MWGWAAVHGTGTPCHPKRCPATTTTSHALTHTAATSHLCHHHCRRRCRRRHHHHDRHGAHSLARTCTPIRAAHMSQRVHVHALHRRLTWCGEPLAGGLPVSTECQSAAHPATPHCQTLRAACALPVCERRALVGGPRNVVSAHVRSKFALPTEIEHDSLCMRTHTRPAPSLPRDLSCLCLCVRANCECSECPRRGAMPRRGTSVERCSFCKCCVLATCIWRACPLCAMLKGVTASVPSKL